MIIYLIIRVTSVSAFSILIAVMESFAVNEIIQRISFPRSDCDAAAPEPRSYSL